MDVAQKRRLLTELMADPRRRTTNGGARAGRTGPVSFAQRRLWIIDSLVPGSSAYNVPVVMRTGTAPDPGKLADALELLIQRHEVLRTVFVSRDGTPVQRVCPPYRPAIEIRDVSGDTDPAHTADGLVRAFTKQPFDLAAGPLLRVLLVRVGQDEHLIALAVHHIVCDGWSIVTMFRELDALYAQLRDGTQANLPELEHQYIEYAIWQRSRLSGDRLTELNDFWRERLDGAPGMLQLPVDAPRRGNLKAAGGSHEFTYSRALRDDIHAFAAKAKTTPFVVVLACFDALLQRYCAQDDIVVGVPAAGQTHSALQGMIGCFMNTLVMRMDLSGAPSLNEAVRRGHGATLDMFAHQDMPFEKLVVELQPDRNPTVTPLFQVLFNFQTASNDRVRLPVLDADLVPFDSGMVRFDLEFNAFVGEDGMGGAWVYNTELLSTAAVERMATLLERLLAAAIAQPDVPLCELDLFEQRDLDEFARIGGTTADVPARGRAAFDLPPDGVVLFAADAGLVEPDEAAWVHDAGARLVVPDAGTGLRDGVLRALAELEVDTLCIAPGLLSHVVDAVERGAVAPAVRRVLVTHEPLSVELEARCLNALPGTEFWSVYRVAGIGDVARRRCAGDSPPGHDIAGTVCPGLAVRVRDTGGRLLPVGAPGQVWAGEVATGDLGRFREDGTLEVLGPLSEQIHVRQVRVLQGEVESALTAHRSVGYARVLPDVAPDGTIVLTAYLAPADGEWTDRDRLRDDIRAHAQRLLPGLVVPRSYVFVDALPLTGRGTVDLAALRSLEHDGRTEPVPAPAGTGADAPRNDTEKLLVDIWRSVLGVDEVGIHDNFFLLGGQSLLAIQLMSRLRRSAGIDLPVSALYRYRTVADLAARVAGLSGETASADGNLVQLQAGPAPAPVVAVHPAGGGVFSYTAMATGLPNRTVYAFEGRSPGASLTALAERYLGQLPDEVLGAPFALAGWSLGGVVAFEMARLQAERGGAAVPVTLIDSSLFDGDPAAPEAEARMVEGYLLGVRADFGLDLPPLTGLDDLPPRQVFADLLAHLGAAAPDVLDLEEMTRQYTVYRSHILNLAAYRPPAPYAGPVQLFLARQSPPGTAAAWREYAPALTVREIDGDHYSIMRNPGLTEVVAGIERQLTGLDPRR